MNVKIFLENTTTIDFAILDSKSGPIGKSLKVDVDFFGKTNSQGMLIDFSKAKRLIKKSVSICDHKIIVSSSDIKLKTKKHVYIKNGDNKIHHVFAMHSPTSWICCLSKKSIAQICNGSFVDLEKKIKSQLRKNLPKNISDICVRLYESESDLAYTHTLCKHFGNCQRFHGHSSKIKAFKNGVFNKSLTNRLIQKLNNQYIISEKNCFTEINSKKMEKFKSTCFVDADFKKIKDHLFFIEYKSKNGFLFLIISKNLVLPLPDESTIENITTHLASSLDPNVQIHLYEGFSKGACSV